MDRERRRQRPRAGGPGPGDEGEGDRLDRLREAGQRFHSAADEAVRRALSGDSVQFLHSNVQEGGQ